MGLKLIAEPTAGTTPEEGASALCAFAARNGMGITTILNGVPMWAYPTSVPREVLAEFEERAKRFRAAQPSTPNPVPAPNSYLVFNPGDGPSIWHVHGIEDGSQCDFLVIAGESSQSVMDAIAQRCPLERFEIQGIKKLEGIVGVIQMSYEDWRFGERPEAEEQ